MSLLIKNVILENKKKDIFIDKGIIKKIENEIKIKADQVIEGKEEKAIFPGLINMHTHAGMNILRGFADDYSLKEWLKEKIWPLEEKIDEEDVYLGTKLACLEMIKTGTTCFNDMYWFPRVITKAIKEMGLRAIVGLPLLDDTQKSSKEKIEKDWEYFKKENSKRINFSVAPHSIYSVKKENLIWAKNFAQKNKLILHLHISETKKEVDDCLKKHKLRPVEYLDKIGFLDSNCVFSHGVWLSKKEIKILKKNNCHLVYNPVSNMKLASGVFPYLDIKKEKVNICLGTDGVCSNNNLDLFEEMKIGALLQKNENSNPSVISAEEIFKMATENAGKALGVKAGKIKVGYLADIILVDLNEICLVPGYNIISNLVYSCSGNCVSDLICHGKILMKERKIKGEKEIISQVKKRAKNKIKKLLN